jgi:hypothetical protein
MVIDEIGQDEEGKPIEILFGALAMQQWGIRPVPDEERLDLTHYPSDALPQRVCRVLNRYRWFTTPRG